MKSVVSPGLRQDEEVGVKSVFLSVIKASILSAINGQKESHRPCEADRAQSADRRHCSPRMPLIIQTPAASFHLLTHLRRKGLR